MYQSPERLAKMMDAVEQTAKMRSRDVQCPLCGHKAFRVYEGSYGYLEAKCKVCKRISTYNLVSMRRIRTHHTDQRTA